jgi:hypothetical protein
MFFTILVCLALTSASLPAANLNEMANLSYRSHCSVVVEIWKEMGGYSPLDPETVEDHECCTYKHSLIPGIVCTQMNFIEEIV